MNLNTLTVERIELHDFNTPDAQPCEYRDGRRISIELDCDQIATVRVGALGLFCPEHAMQTLTQWAAEVTA